jgi:N-ethylmaleimide reductase
MDLAQPLLRPYRMGNLQLANRIVMAPLTRSRATDPDLAPTELHARYYRQRASAGLIITEAHGSAPRPSDGTTCRGCSPKRKFAGG